MVLTRTDLEDIKTVISQEVRTIFADQIKSDLIEAITKTIEAKFETKFKSMQTELNTSRSEILEIQRENQNLKKIIDSNEQYSRRKNLRIFGMDNEKNEDPLHSVLHLFNNTMKISNINKTDIKKCHRVSPMNQSSDKPPAILVEFYDVNKRSEVLLHRKILRNTKISVKEDLTQHRLKLLNAAVSKFSAKNAWCLHGNIYVRSAGVVKRIDSEGDIIRLEP